MKVDNQVKVNIPILFYFIIFTISGFSGLIYESIWSHYLKLFLGHAAFAQSLVLIIFMGGMAIGAWWASRFTDKLKSPILAYVVIELLIGLTALFFHGAFTSVLEYFYQTLFPSLNSQQLASMLKWAAAALLILPQSILLGMTFPLLTAGVLRRYENAPGAKIAMLYFSNSIGAAVGVLVSAFFLIKLFGLPGTIFTAGIINIVLALLTYLVLRLDSGEQTDIAVKADGHKDSSFLNVIDSTFNVNVFLFVAFFTGAASFIYEIAWIRLLSMVLGSTTHSFELMLSAFITGLALGGFWIKRHIDKIEDPIRYLAYIQIIMGVFAILTIPLYMLTYDWMSSVVEVLNHSSEQGYSAYLLISHIICILVMLPTTFCAGTTLPLVTYVLLNKGYGEKSIGHVYSVNTVGAIVGVLFSIHIGMIILGLKWLIVFGAILDVLVGYSLLRKFTKAKSENRKWNVIIYAVPVAVLLWVGIFIKYDHSLLTSGVYRTGKTNIDKRRDVIFYRDGKSATIGFTTEENNGDAYGLIITNGKPDAALNLNIESANRSADEITMVLAGAIPLAIVPNAKTVANIGFGSGMTTHTLLADKDIEVVDTIEIEAAMVEGARNFGELVERAYTDPRSSIHIDDAKTFFSVNNKKYDIIIAEPSNPWVSGVSSLFSNEFYHNIKNYLEDDGVFVQWIQLYEFSDELLFSILRTLDNNFEDMLLFNTDSYDLLIVSKKKKNQHVTMDTSRIFKGLLKEDLARQHITSDSDIAIRFAGNKKMVQSLLQLSDAPINSDYYSFLDNNASEARFRRQSVDFINHIASAPVPINEILYNSIDIDFSGIKKDKNLERSEKYIRARNIVKYFQGNLSAQDKVDLGVTWMQTLATLQQLNTSCEHIQYTKLWRDSLYQVGINSLAYLSADVADSLFAGFMQNDCNWREDNLNKKIIETYRAIARRDIPKIIELGESVLNGGQTFKPYEHNLFISAVLLGHISEGDFKRAQLLKEEFVDKNTSSYGARAYEKLLISEIKGEE